MLSLERSEAAEAEARALMACLPDLAEGKMFGVLLTAEGPVLKAYSGQWLEHQDWAPPIFTPSPSLVPAQLDQLKAELMEASAHPAFSQLRQMQEAWQARVQSFEDQRRQARLRRAQQRQSGGGAELDLESQREGTRWRQMRAQRQSELAPLQAQVRALESRIVALKQKRKQLSRAYQQELHRELWMCLSAGQSWSLASLFPKGPPTGTGDCAAPKLLYQAAQSGLTPIAMAEFWWGPEQSGRQPGRFYSACAQRCQPLIGPLLSRARPLEILYQDEELLAVLKPAGVLTVPGRQNWNQDSLWQRLKARFPELRAVHRLDLETSGVCLFALTPECQRNLQRQFAERQVVKRYEAILTRDPRVDEGIIDQALGPDPLRPGCYLLDRTGKPSQTEFRRVCELRYEFRPRTGRSHQIRVHAAQALLSPILGDNLYGGGPGPLHLHARSLELDHRGSRLRLEAPNRF
ncbi:RluA family pseudouridine synthase [bacterium]|nr:RluA family pseudouridine synthase [bacterium]